MRKQGPPSVGTPPNMATASLAGALGRSTPTTVAQQLPAVVLPALRTGCPPPRLPAAHSTTVWKVPLAARPAALALFDPH
eukprot:scaffold144811_cov20-Tisochrysis_lutea.AAC.2